MGKLKKRKVSSWFIKPGFQMKFGFYLTAFCFLLSSLLLYVFIAFNLEQISLLTRYCPDETIINLVSQDLFRSGLLIIAFFAVLSIMAFFVSFEISHRVVGPERKLNSMVQDLLSERFESRVTLREKDEFQELAEALNKLAEKLESGKN